MSFLKPPVFVKTILLSCAFFASMFFNSCKQLTSFDPNVDGVRVAASNTFSAPADVKATQGRKQMISLEWTPVSGAKYYDVYCAESATAEFKKIGGTDKNSFDDRVGAGRTLYYRVCATKSDGTQSEFSATVKGTSLAQPVISGGDVNDCSATISWFMENARAVDGADNYESSLMFVVHWQQKNGGTPNEVTLSAKEDFKNSFYEYKIENLSGAEDYEFWIEAYLSGDQSSSESSPRVDKKTLTSYTPLAPVFTATQGKSAKGIWLFITLPDKVMVQTETKLSPNEKVDEPYPLYFKIYRKIGEVGEEDSEADWGSPVCEHLYCNETTTPPAEAEYADAYNVGAEIKWFDESANLVGGEKYTYRIISYSDTDNYDKVVCPEGKKNNSVPTPPSKATTALGWKSAHPDFKVNYSADSRTLSSDNTKVVSVSFGFDAGWKDLGKAGDYKFAIKQNKKPWTVDYSGEVENSWLVNASGEQFFDTIEAIKSCVVKFGSESDLKSEEGVYSYTLYVVLKDAAIGDVTDNGEKVLDSVKATDEIVVTDVVELPKAELEVQGGYKDKVVLTITYEQGVTYKVVRTRLDTTPQGAPEEIDIPLPENPGTSFEYSDSVEGKDNGRRYSYILKAIADNGAFSLSQSREAETLGTPKVSFNSDVLSYNSVTISFDGVLAAKEYAVKLGASGGFGGGKEFKFEPGFVGAKGNADVSLKGNTYIVTIKNPDGYDNATLAGKHADVTVTAHSNVNDAPSDSVPVNVLGPALLDAKVNTAAEATEETITLTWNKMDGANGYLIRRVMYETADSNAVAADSEVTYYYEVATGRYEVAIGSDTTAGDNPNDSDVRVKVEPGDASFTLTDTYKKANPNAEASVQTYQAAQAKISWGLPFKYVVLPVLAKDDFVFASKSLALAEDGNKVPYSNIDKIETKEAATLGYGLNLVADKATSGTTQHIKWDKPHEDKTATTRPIVYHRPAGESGVFTRFRDGSDEVFDENAKMNIKTTDEDSLCGAFEYLVKYYPKGASTDEVISPPNSLLEYIASENQTEKYPTPEGEKEEQNNKGYLLAIKGFSAEIDNSKDYYERISWEPWNYKTRAVGPDTMSILIQNNNISAEYQEAVTIEQANANKTINYVGNDIDGEKLGDSSIHIKPKSISANGTGTAAADGLLKVLLDYRHNYSYKLQRSGDEEPIIASFEKDIVKTAYRQITAKEFLILSMDTIRSSFKKKWYTEGSAGGGLNSTSFSGSVGGTCYTGIDRDGFFSTNYRRYQRFVNYKDSFVKINGTMMKDNGGGVGSNQYQGTWLHNGSSWPSENNFLPQEDHLTIIVDNLIEGQIKLNSIKIKNNDTNAPDWESGTFEVTYNGETKSFGKDQIPFGFLMDDNTFYRKVEEMP